MENRDYFKKVINPAQNTIYFLSPILHPQWEIKFIKFNRKHERKFRLLRFERMNVFSIILIINVKILSTVTKPWKYRLVLNKTGTTICKKKKKMFLKLVFELLFVFGEWNCVRKGEWNWIVVRGNTKEWLFRLWKPTKIFYKVGCICWYNFFLLVVVDIIQNHLDTEWGNCLLNRSVACF